MPKNATMYIGVARITLRLPENQNLKGKRKVIQSLSARLRNQFKIAVAEVSENDLWQLATLGITCVSNDKQHINQLLNHVMTFVQDQTGEFELLDQHQEILSAKI
jgi:uncharacterized protein